MPGRTAMTFAAVLALLLVAAVGPASGQESRPAPGSSGAGQPGSTGQHGMMGGGMTMCPMMGMMSGMGRAGGHGGDAGRRRQDRGRALRLRADMLRAMSDVLQRHAAELEKGQ